MGQIVILVPGHGQESVGITADAVAYVKSLQKRTISDSMALANVHLVCPFDQDELTVAEKRVFDAAIGNRLSNLKATATDTQAVVLVPAQTLRKRPWMNDWASAVTALGDSVHVYDRGGSGIRIEDTDRFARLFPETWLSDAEADSVLPDQPRVCLASPVGLQLRGQEEVMKKGQGSGASKEDAILCVLAEREKPVLPLGTALAVGGITTIAVTEGNNNWDRKEKTIRVWHRGDCREAGLSDLAAQSVKAFADIPALSEVGESGLCQTAYDEASHTLSVAGEKLGGLWAARRVVKDRWDRESKQALIRRDLFIPCPHVAEASTTQPERRADTSNPFRKCTDRMIWVEDGRSPFAFVDEARCVILNQLMPKVRECLAYWRNNCLALPRDGRHQQWTEKEDSGGLPVAYLAEGVWREFCPWPDPLVLRAASELVVEPALAKGAVKELFKIFATAPLGAAPDDLVCNFLAVIGYAQYDMHAWAAEFVNAWFFKLKTRDHYWIEGTILPIPVELRRAENTLLVENYRRRGDGCVTYLAGLEYQGIHCSIRAETNRP